MHKTFDEQVVELHKDAERRHGADRAAVFLAQLVAHEIALEPRFHIARRLVGTTLVGRTVQAEFVPDRIALVGRARLACRLVFLLQVARPGGQPRHQFNARRHLRLILAAGEDSLDAPVRQQVRITADRAGEMGIRRIRETKVADILGAVDRLLHGAQHHRLQHRRVGTRLDLRHQLGIVACGGLVAAAEREPLRLQEGAQDIELFTRRTRVNPVQAVLLVPFQEIGRAHVRREHAFLDEAVRIVAGARQDLLDLALCVAHDIRFTRIEFDCATRLARLGEDLVKVIQILQVRQQRGAALGLGTFGVAEHGRDFGVGQARRGVHHGLIELVGLDLAVGRDGRVAHQHAAIDFGVERAQTVRQLLGQHRDDAARKIDGRAAAKRIGIERTARRDVVGHVRDGHDQAIAVGAADLARFAIHRIIEVARVLAVDGDERHVAQIDAVLEIGRADLVRQSAGSGQRFGRELVRHAVFAHGDLDFHAGVVDIAEHLGHAPNRLTVAARVIGQLHAHDLADLGLALRTWRNQDVVPDALVFGCHDHHAVFIEQAANHMRVRATCDFDDVPFRPAAPVETGHTQQHPVVVHDLLHLFGRQIQVVAVVVTHRKAVSVAVPDYAARDEVRRMRQLVVATPVEANLIVALHRREAFEEAFAFLLLDGQRLGDVVRGERRLGGSKDTENFFAARDRIRIFAQRSVIAVNAGEFRPIGAPCA
ncbi:hypothetical protein PTE30175_01695 [Pandoraea terrae]|uniref:Uncharacterized protein n=1 Tax=Pandoraea terrae TaxID=1537710 RepID=A0A5E4U2C9_9BURK|nr:hypothetical protein PTE30175_01695 [Pandoraea terrae]